MEKIPKSALFKRYIISYVTVFSIPLIIFLVVIHMVYIQNLQDEITTTNQSLLDQVNQKLDERILATNAIGNQIKYGHRGYSANSMTETIQYVEKLRMHDLSTRNSNGIYVLLSDQDTVISSKGSLSTTALLNNVKHFDVVEKEQLINLLSDPTEKISVFTQKSVTAGDAVHEKVVYYTMPLLKSVSNNGVIIFVMNMTGMGSNPSVAVGDGALSYIIDSEGDIITISGNFTNISLETLKKSQNKILENDEITFNRTNYITNTTKNTLTGWTIVSLTETRQIYAPLYKVLFVFGILMVAMAIMGMIISYYFATKHYRPIKTLTSSFQFDGDGVYDEFDFLQANIKRTKTENSKLYQLMNDQAPIIRNGALLNMIEGKHVEADKIQNTLNEIGLYFPYSQFSLLIISFKQNPNEADEVFGIENLVQTLVDKPHRIPGVYIEAAVPYLKNNQILMIVNLDKESQQMWDEVMGFVMEQIITEKVSDHEGWRIAVGNTYDSLLKLKNSYIEASTALEATKPDCEDAIVFFKNLTNKNTKERLKEAFQYPREELLLLIQSIKKGNQVTALELLDETFSEIDKTVPNSIAKQAVIADIVNNILQLSVELDMTDQYGKIYELADFSSTRNTKPILAGIINEICVSINEREECQGSAIKQQVVQYIHDNFDSPDISLGEIAAKTNISISYASRLIKEETGESFSNMVQTLRMNRFKELLIDTDESIKNLITQIGYYDASNFTRKFRKENGITPSEFRDRFQTVKLK